MDRACPGEELRSFGAGGRSRSALAATARIGLLWLLPLIGALVTLAIVFHELHQTAVDAPIINLAGRQRLLSQQLLAHAVAVHDGRDEDRARVRDLVGAFDNAFHILENGGEGMGQTLPAAPAEIQSEFDEVRRWWQGLKPALLVVSGGGGGSRTPGRNRLTGTCAPICTR